VGGAPWTGPFQSTSYPRGSSRPTWPSAVFANAFFTSASTDSLVAPQPVILRLVDPLDVALFIHEQGGGDGHGLERWRERERAENVIHSADCRPAKYLGQESKRSDVSS